MPIESFVPPDLPPGIINFDSRTKPVLPPDLIIDGDLFKPIEINPQTLPENIIRQARSAANEYKSFQDKFQQDVLKKIEFSQSMVRLLVQSCFIGNNANTILALQNIVKRTFGDKPDSSILTGIMSEACFCVAAMQLGYDVYQSNPIWDAYRKTDFFVTRNGRLLEVDVKSSLPDILPEQSFTDSYIQVVLRPYVIHPQKGYMYRFPLNKTEHMKEFTDLEYQLRLAMKATKVEAIPPPLSQNQLPSSHRALHYSLHLPEAAVSATLGEEMA